MGRPRKYASAAERQAAYRNRYELVEARVIKETGATLTSIAAELDVSRSELVNSLINFALLNRDWRKLGLFGKRLPHASDRRNNPDDEEGE